MSGASHVAATSVALWIVCPTSHCWSTPPLVRITLPPYVFAVTAVPYTQVNVVGESTVTWTGIEKFAKFVWSRLPLIVTQLFVTSPWLDAVVIVAVVVPVLTALTIFATGRVIDLGLNTLNRGLSGN